MQKPIEAGGVGSTRAVVTGGCDIPDDSTGVELQSSEVIPLDGLDISPVSYLYRLIKRLLINKRYHI